MTYSEFLVWANYISKRGSISIPNRLESGFALVSTVVSNVNGNKNKVHDFMPHFREPEPEVTHDISAAMSIIQSVARPKDSFRLKEGG